MQLIDVNLAEEPVNLEKFQYYPSEDYPKIILGCLIRHKYDQERLIINEKYNSESIHFIENKPYIKSYFFTGIPIKFSKKYLSLLSDVENISDSYSDYTENLNEYKTILEKHKLSCNDCSLIFDNNIFPIDGKHLDKLTGNKLKINQLYKDFFTHNSENCFQCFGSLSIFILTSSLLSDESYESLYQGAELVVA
jgi:hypothetical protein